MANRYTARVGAPLVLALVFVLDREVYAKYARHGIYRIYFSHV
jgi:hypothetical protein